MILLDTHAVVWWASSPSKLSTKARQAAQSAARDRALGVSAISIFEIVTAERRGRLKFVVPIENWLAALRQLPELTIHPVTGEVAEMAGSFDDTMPGDPADRLIASTAILLSAPLITADSKLRDAPRINTIW